MSLLVNLRHLVTKSIQLKGEIPVAELALDLHDELIQARSPLQHDLEVQKLDQSLLVQGDLKLPLECQCARCLKPYRQEIVLTRWACHIPLEGEEKPPIISDSVDLTPYIREDILLQLPQHPLCDANCGGLQKAKTGSAKSKGSDQTPNVSSAWAELDKLKL